MSATGLAVRAGVSVPYISQLESGLRAPSLAAIISLAGALGVEPSELLLVPETPHAALMKAIRARDWEAVEAALDALGMPPRPTVRAPGDG
jgi:transcriptional regulator with XRE-family HTH domain